MQAIVATASSFIFITKPLFEKRHREANTPAEVSMEAPVPQ
jgi:hypothetical protein